MQNSVLIVGSIALDTVKTSTEEHADLLGGSASYAAVAASLFAPVQLVGVVGDDFPSQHRQLLADRNIDLTGLEVAPGKTFRWSGEYEVDMNNRRTRSVELNVFEKFHPKLPESYRNAEYVLLANIAPSLQSEVLDQLKKPKLVVADTMDLWINNARQDLLALLKRVDGLILNDSEARQFMAENNLIKAGRKILELGPKFVAIKKGEHGCLLFSRDDFFSTGAHPLEEIIDPTGAGDSFAGAFMGHCARTNDISFANLKRAVVKGSLVASFNVESFSLRRLQSLNADQLEERYNLFRNYCAFHDA